MIEPIIFFSKLAFRLPYSLVKAWVGGSLAELGSSKAVARVFLSEFAENLDPVTLRWVVNPVLRSVNVLSLWWLGAAGSDGRLRWLYKEEGAPVLLYVHGGGMCVDMFACSLGYLKLLKKEIGHLSIAIADYSLCARYPQAIEDVWTEYKKIIDEHKEVWLMGDSAGGNLGMNILQRCASDYTRFPEKCVLISPWLNVTKSETSFAHPGTDDYLTRNQLAMFKNVYAPNGSHQDPFLNIEANFDDGLWTTIMRHTKFIVLCGSDEILCPEIIRLCSKLAKIDEDRVKMCMEPRGVHCNTLLFDTWDPYAEHSSFPEILRFLRSDFYEKA